MPLLPFLLVLLSAFFHAAWNLAAKKVDGNIGVFYIGILGASLLLLPTIFFFPLTPLFTSPAYLYFLATGALNALYVFLLAHAYAHGSVSTVYPIARGSSVVGTAIAAVVFLHEKISLLGSLGVALVAIGIMLVAARGRDKNIVRSITLALLIGITITIYSIIDKLGVATIHPLIYIHGVFLLSILFLTPYVFLRKRSQLKQALREHKRLAAFIGTGSLLAYGIILFAFRIADASYVVALREVSIIIASFLGFWLFNEHRSPIIIAGIVIIVTGIVVIRLA